MQPQLNALASPRRREILRLVWDRERTAGEINRQLSDVTFGATSQQLAVLRRSGLVTVRRQGRRRFYRACPEPLRPFREWLQSSWDDALYRLKLEAELEEARRGPRAAAKGRTALD